MSADKQFTFEELKALSGKDNLHLLVSGKGESIHYSISNPITDLLCSLRRRPVCRRSKSGWQILTPPPSAGFFHFL